jgi:chromosome segregation ATPase
MNTALIVSIGVAVFLVVIFLVIYFSLKRRKKAKSPILERANDTIVIVTQRIHTMNQRIKKLDENVTKLVIAKEKNDSSLIDETIDMENIQTKINQNKKEIEELIADIKDLRDYKTEIEDIIKIKDETRLEELEKLLDAVKEKLQYRFI